MSITLQIEKIVTEHTSIWIRH